MRAISYENKNFDIKEPFNGLFTQGMVCHETYKDKNNNWVSPEDIETIEGKKFLKKDKSKITVGPSESMSKSKKNTIDPENIILNYGADAARLFILSDSPPDKDVQWSEEGIASSFKFIQKLWSLNLKFLNQIKQNHSKDSDNEIEKNTNLFIKKITENLENFSYNKIVANLHEMNTFFVKNIEKKYTKETLLRNYKKILVSITPIIPHFATECLNVLKIDNNLKWPSFDEEILKEDFINIVIQINGKKRGIINTQTDITEENLIKLVNNDDKLLKYLNTGTIKKRIFIKNKLMNIIIQ